MLHPIFTTSFADREMFAANVKYRKSQEAKKEMERVLAQPETRIAYSFEFLNDFSDCEESRSKCYNKIAEWSDKLDTSEYHF